MPTEVVMEVRGRDDWVRVGSVSDVDPLGSISDERPSGRQVVMFGWHEGRPGVWLSTGGVDLANVAVREVHTLGLERLSDLSEPLVMDRHYRGRRVKVRFRVE
jgi:hypothetical protein